MASKQEYKLRTALSTLAAATLLGLAGAGSPAALAQTATLQPPASGLKNTARNSTGMGNVPTSALGAPAAAPLAGPVGQIGHVPAVGLAPARASTNAAVVKNYQLKAQVVPGAALSATQKLATAMAALAELATQARDQQDKETQEKLAMLQKTLSIGNSASLSILSPRSPVGSAKLHVRMADTVDFENNRVSFNPGFLKTYGNLIGWPAAYCHFKVAEDGFYMVAFTVENSPNVGGTTTVKAAISHIGAWHPENETKVTLNKGVSVVAVIQEFRKGEDATALITSDDIFAFNACDISRIK